MKLPRMATEDCSFETLKADPRPLKARKQKQISELGRNKHNFLSPTRAQRRRETFNDAISIDDAHCVTAELSTHVGVVCFGFFFFFFS